MWSFNKFWICFFGRPFFVLFLVCTVYFCTSCGDKTEKENPAETKTSSVAPANLATPRFEHWYFQTAEAALREVIRRTEPRVIGFGEYHQTSETKGIVSALERFRRELLPVLAPLTSDLLVETWLSEGNCGETENALVGQVEQVSRRPKETEDENLVLLKSAKGLGVQPHILEMSCEDYAGVMKDAGVDYFEMLALVARRLESKSELLLSKKKSEMLMVYSGAIHNDLAPSEDFAEFTYAPNIAKAAQGKFVEVDLYVPEFVETSETAKLEEWYSQFIELVSPDRVFLMKTGEASYIIGFRKGVRSGGEDAEKSD